MATTFTLTRQNPTTGTITAQAFADDGTAYAVGVAATGTHPLYRVTRAALGLSATDTGYVIWYEDGAAISHEGFRAEERGTDGAYTGTPPTPLDAAGVRSAVGLAAANLDTQLAAIVEDTGTTLPALFPSNFASLGINASGHLSRVTLVDTTTANTDMRGTDGANTTAPDNAGIAAAKAAAEAIKVVTDKLDDTLADNAGTFQFTVAALENAPSGGGAGGEVDLTTESIELVANSLAQTLADAHGEGSWESSGDVGATPQQIWEYESRSLSSFGTLVTDIRDAILNRVLAGNHDEAGTFGKVIQTIAAKTGLIGTGSATVAAPVTETGTIPAIYQGDDYSSGDGRALGFTFSIGSMTIAGGSSAFEANPVQGCSFAAEGTVADNGDGTATATIPITSAQTDLLVTGPVAWSALFITPTGDRVTVKEGSSPLKRRKHR